MKSLYFLTSLVALAAAVPSPAPAPGPIDWFRRNILRQTPEQQQRAVALRANSATSAELRFFSDQVPRGQSYNVSLPSTTVINVAANRRPTRIQLVRGPEGARAVCVIVDRYGAVKLDQNGDIAEESRFSEGLNNAYIAPEGTPEVGYISCFIEQQAVSQAILRFSSPGANAAQVSDQTVSVPGAVRVNDPALQRATQVAMIQRPVPNTICFIMDEINNRAVTIGQVSIESRRPFQSTNGQANIKYISCLPPAENLQQ